MSRHEIIADVMVNDVLLRSADVSYGFDHVCGYFIQVFSADNPDVPVFDEDSAFSSLTGSKMLDAFEEMGIYDHVSEEHKTAMALDLPIP